MRQFLITFIGVLWFVYVLSSFVIGNFNFFEWRTETRFIVGFFGVLVGSAIAIGVSSNNHDNNSNL